MRRPLARNRLLYWTIGQLAITGKGFLAGGKNGKIKLIGKYVWRNQIGRPGRAARGNRRTDDGQPAKTRTSA